LTRIKQRSIAAIVALVSAFCIFVYFYPLVTVHARLFVVDDAQIEVDFERLIDDADERNFFRQPLAQYSAALLAMNPQLNEVHCRLSLSGNVICTGERKKPAALISLPDLHGLSSRGELIPYRDCDNISDLLVITGIRLDETPPYTAVSSDEVREALRVCLMMKYRFPRLHNAISEIDMSSPESPVLYMRNSNSRVVVGRGEYNLKLRRLYAIMSHGSLPSGAEIDLRFGRSVVAKRLT
jgi:hypothetical protein